MKILFFVLALVLPLIDAYIPHILHGRPRGGFLGNPGGLPEGANVQSQSGVWFEQPLNHFDQADTRTWKQKYYETGTFYKLGGPVFVQIGGEGKANPIWLTNGAWTHYAQVYGAHCVLVEHRFYGDSHPTPDMSTSNLKYLSSEQALADLANVVAYFKAKMDGAKVIVFGGSYSGALAAWFRMKYPHLADGAVASSAPVLAKVDFKEYLEVVDASIATFGDHGMCNSNVNMATALLLHSLHNEQGRKYLKKAFNLCEDIDLANQKDVDNLFSTLGNNFFGVVQYNKDNRAFEGAKDAKITIDTICGIMTDAETHSNQLDRYAAVNTLIMKAHGTKCVDFSYASMIKDLQATAWNSSAAEGGRQWTYQTCVEFAFFQSTDSMQQPFGHFFPVKFFIQQCADIFGPEFTEAVISAGVKHTNIHYGARDLKVTRVVFPNGSIDPWHALGILTDLNPEAKAIYINGTAHCANMYPASPHDLPSLNIARATIQRHISMWLNE